MRRLSADVAGYVRLTRADEEGTHRRLMACRARVLDPLVTGHGGRIVKGTGDGVLAEFPGAVAAVRCALSVQRELAAGGDAAAKGCSLPFRIGVALGEILAEPDDIYGDAVNLVGHLPRTAPFLRAAAVR